ncbi:hypothetical protein KQX54_002309 [Cotesia glomerata]|uniref:Uncharacterized protein n=1 Tax=Cotesia glomerata TaxID=32391 RepID=A0AAV7IXW3_COTGL|nr:hypothetical protein KQX54_002309 [Cotesia glomerata]
MGGNSGICGKSRTNIVHRMGAWTEDISVKVVKFSQELESVSDTRTKISPRRIIDDRNRRIRIHQQIDCDCNADTSTTNKKRTTTATTTTAISTSIKLRNITLIIIKIVFHHVLITLLLVYKLTHKNTTNFNLKITKINYLCV